MADTKDQKQQTEADTGSVTTHSSHGSIHCITIIGTIEGHQEAPEATKTTKYEHVLPQLAAIEETPDIDGLLILLNTAGGDVEAGLAIAELIAGMHKPTISLVLGGGHSIGIPLAVSGRVTMIAPSASMTIHPVRMTGMMIAAPQTYQYFTRLQESIVRFVARSSRISEEKFRELMLHGNDMASDVGTVVYGEEAVQLGLIDRVGQLKDAYEALYAML